MFRARLFVCLTALAGFGQAPPGLAGRWRSVETSKGGIGAMFEFRNDGTFRFSPGAVVEMKYRIEGTQLILPPETINGPEQSESMEFVDSDHLVLNKTKTLTRQGTSPDPNHPIVGEWTTPMETAGVKSDVHFLFEPEGNSLLLIPFKWQEGQYSVKGATIRIQFPTGAPIEGPFRVEGDVLNIPSSGKTGQARLRRY